MISGFRISEAAGDLLLDERRLADAGVPLLRRGLKMQHFRLFAALAETGQISAAADMLSLSQPVASRIAAEAEQLAGVKLYQRTSRGIVLTGAGEALARRARRMLIEVEETARELQELHLGHAGRVNIGSVTGPSVEHVLPAIRQARVTLPKVTVNLDVSTSDVLAAALLEGTLDFAIARIPAGRDPRLFDMRMIGPEPMSLVVRTNHPLLRNPPQSVDTLMDYDWVLPGEGTMLRTTLETELTRRGLPLPRKVLNTSSFLLTLVTVRQTNAIAPVATSVAEFFASETGMGGAVAELPLPFPLEVEPYGLMTVRGRAHTPAARKVLDILLATIAASKMKQRFEAQHVSED
jgi:DNA-binding transcriptional LysR family regulator